MPCASSMNQILWTGRIGTWSPTTPSPHTMAVEGWFLLDIPPVRDLERMEYSMVYYLIICRSLTYAQRTEAALSRAGISARVMRAPKTIDSEGCSHGVRVSERSLAPALMVLAKAGLSPRRVFIMAPNGAYQEVLL